MYIAMRTQGPSTGGKSPDDGLLSQQGEVQSALVLAREKGGEEKVRVVMV